MRTSNSVRYQVWDDDQCAQVVNAAYRVLERTGCKVQNERALELLKNAGCLVNGEHVRIPHALMEWAVDAAPSAFTIYDRLGAPAMNLEPHSTYFGTTIGDTYVLDGETGERRLGTKADAVASALVCDAMPNVDWAASITMVGDGMDVLAEVYEVQCVLPNTTKPIMYWSHSMENLAYQIEMLEVIAGGADELRAKPFAMNLNTPVDPLMHNEVGLNVLMHLAKKRLPATYVAGIGFGVAGPATPAGGIIVGLADTLAGLLVGQLTQEGAPFIAAVFKDNVNFGTLMISHSGPEFTMANAATADVFRFLGLPFTSNGGDSDTGRVDQVFVLDHMAQAYTAALAGANLNFGGAGCESANSSAVNGIVVYNDIVGFVKRLVAGVEISEYTLAEDEIHRVGPGGNFVAEDRTLKHCRENWTPLALVPRTYEEWIASGRQDVADIANEAVREIVTEGPRKPLSDDVVSAIDAIVMRAEEEMGAVAAPILPGH